MNFPANILHMLLPCLFIVLFLLILFAFYVFKGKIGILKTFKIVCPHCRKRYRILYNRLNPQYDTYICKHCKTRITLVNGSIYSFETLKQQTLPSAAKVVNMLADLSRYKLFDSSLLRNIYTRIFNELNIFIKEEKRRLSAVLQIPKNCTLFAMPVCAE